MLESLSVENYALIERLEMTLDPSLNIITGETGAGKSILLGALGLLLGGKNDGSATKDNSKSCIIEGCFNIAALGLEELFTERDWDYEESITIRRVITAAGKSRSFVGDIPVSLADVKELSSRLIDIHSQHNNQIVASGDFRLHAIDTLCDTVAERDKYREERDRYRDKYTTLQTLRASLREVEAVAATARRDEEWLTHQVEELTKAELKENEAEAAEAELQILENAEGITETLKAFCGRMDSDDERGVILMVHTSEREMRGIAESYPPAVEYAERLSSIYAELKDLNSSILDESESIEADPERLERLGERIDTLYSLCQKHRVQSVEELIEVRDRYSEQLLTILNSDDKIASLKAQIEKIEAEAWSMARSISKKRSAAAPKFERHIIGTLGRLGISTARFKVEVTQSSDLTASGCDTVDFLFSSVEGKSLQPVEKIASGGEISRVMLALKVLLAERMELPTIIFDEIDTGVSGRIADAMGEIIAELSQRLQVVDITHLPQVASKGSTHFVVYKEEGKSSITRLTPEQRIDHIATMLSGSSITSAAREQSKILLGL